MAWKDDNKQAKRPWVGPVVSYSLVKEFLIVAPLLLVALVVLAVLFSSPDKPAITIKDWASAAPKDYLATMASELDGTSKTATYGPPYNTGSCGSKPLGQSCAASLQNVGPISPQKWAGVKLPISGPDLVIPPLESLQGGSPVLSRALAAWNAASPSQQVAWATAYSTALQHATISSNGTISITPTKSVGPLPVMGQAWFNNGRSGAIDAAMIQQPSAFYGSDRTKPLLLLEDGSYFGNIGSQLNFTGSQWGIVNEEGNWPGAWWLMPYVVWYNIPPGNTSSSADLFAMLIVAIIALLTILVPFVPGLRSLPRKLGVYKLVWRSYYANYPSRHVSDKQ
jgi:hypothetical protein